MHATVTNLNIHVLKKSQPREKSCTLEPVKKEGSQMLHTSNGFWINCSRFWTALHQLQLPNWIINHAGSLIRGRFHWSKWSTRWKLFRWEFRQDLLCCLNLYCQQLWEEVFAEKNKVQSYKISHLFLKFPLSNALISSQDSNFKTLSPSFFDGSTHLLRINPSWLTAILKCIETLSTPSGLQVS